MNANNIKDIGFTLITEADLGIDYSKLEFKTFCIVTSDDEEPMVCEYDYILKHYSEYLPAISAVNSDPKGSHYIGFNRNTGIESVGKTHYSEPGYTEIQWD